MFAVQIGDVVAALPNAVGSLKLGPVHAATQGVERSNIDLRHSKALRVGHAGVDAVGGRGNVVVHGEVGLVIVDVTKPGFIHPARIRSPGPVTSARDWLLTLGGQPLRLEEGLILRGFKVASPEDHAIQGVALVDVVVDLSQHAV